MTIGLGIRYSGGILIATDSKLSYGEVSQSYEQKISVFEDRGSFLAIGYAGSVPFAKMFIEGCERYFYDLADKSKSSIRSYVAERLKSFHSEYIYPHPQRGYTGGPDFNLIVGIQSKIDGLDLISTNDCALTDIHLFQCIGIGEYLARYIISQEFVPFGTKEQAETLAMKALQETIKYVPGCGGRRQIIFLQQGPTEMLVGT